MPRFFRNLGLQKKIFLLCLLVSLIPVIFLGTFSYRQIRSLLMERERTALTDSLVQESTRLHSQLREFENAMNYIVFNENIKQILNQTYDNNYDMYIAYTDTLTPFFSTMKSLHSDIRDITIYTDLPIYPRGTTLLPLSEVENLSWYSEVYNSYNSLWFFSPETQSLSLVRQFYNIAKGYTALIKIELDYTSVFSSLTSLYNESYGILLTDENNTPVFQYQTADITDSDDCSLFESPQILNTFLTENTLTDYILEKKTDVTNGWSLFLYRPIHTISESAHVITQTVLIIIFVCLICVILLSSALSGTVIQPLKNLTDNMQYVELGSYEVTVNYDSSDEIGRLIKTFQNMVNQINHLINETLKSKILLQEQEMRALRAQINPHFLYNALSLINSKAILTGQSEISQMAQFLSTFYRTTLNKGKDMISVKEELKNVRAYINIQLLMHSDSFDVLYDIDENVLSLTMSNLLLQPLVENAIIHGVDQRDESKSGRGFLKISAHRSGNTLVFQVFDNGPGIPKTKLRTMLTDPSSGYGIQNVQNRIQLFYGVQYGLHYQSQIGAGTTVTLTIPIVS